MRVLHITGNEMNGSNGIGRLLPEMVAMQNLYGDEMECALCCINDSYRSNVFKVIEKEEITEDVIDSFDFFIFHGVYFYSYLNLAKRIVKRGKFYLIKPHSSLVRDAQNKSYYKKKIANVLFFKRFINGAKSVIFTNEDERIKSIYSDGDFLYEPNGLDSIQKKYDLTNLKKCGSSSYRFVYLSRIDFSHKGTDLLLDALFFLKNEMGLQDINLSFYGQGSEDEERTLIRRISELGFKGVSFCGPIYGDKKWSMLMEKDIFILTSRYEGFPMAILEALDIGLPCLVTRGVNMTGIINHYPVGWECNGEPRDIANLIMDVIGLPPSAVQKMSIAARQYIVENHDWPSLVRKSKELYIDLYKEQI